MNVHVNTVKFFFLCLFGVLGVMVAVASPAEAQAECTYCKSCGTGKVYSAPLLSGTGNFCDEECGYCNGTCGGFCEPEVNIRIDTNRRLLLAKQLGPNQIQVRRGIGGRELIRGIVSLDLPPGGMTAEVLADLRIAMSPSVCEEATEAAVVSTEGS